MEKLLYEIKPYGLILIGILGLWVGYQAILGSVCSVLLILTSGIILRLRYERRRR